MALTDEEKLKLLQSKQAELEATNRLLPKIKELEKQVILQKSRESGQNFINDA